MKLTLGLAPDDVWHVLTLQESGVWTLRCTDEPTQPSDPTIAPRQITELPRGAPLPDERPYCPACLQLDKLQPP